MDRDGAQHHRTLCSPPCRALPEGHERQPSPPARAEPGAGLQPCADTADRPPAGPAIAGRTAPARPALHRRHSTGLPVRRAPAACLLADLAVVAPPTPPERP